MSGRNGALVLAAVFGLAVYAFQLGVGIGYVDQQREAYPPYQDASPHEAGLRVPASAQPPNRQPCLRPQNRDESELCAQYRAADAADRAAFWAKWQFWVNLFGILGLGGTIYLTIRATNAAIESNRISRSTAKRQLRPWLYYDKGFVETDQHGEPEVCVELKNFGASPATCVDITISGQVLPYPFDHVIHHPEGDFPRKRDVAPGHSIKIFEDAPKSIGVHEAMQIRVSIRYAVDNDEVDDCELYLICDHWDFRKKRMRSLSVRDMKSGQLPPQTHINR